MGTVRTIGRKLTVCIIEGRINIRKYIEQTFKTSSDFSCLPAFRNGDNACKEIPPLCPDIVLADIRLYGMNSIQCIRRLKEKCPQTQFIMFSIDVENEEIFFDFLLTGANGCFLEKTPGNMISMTIKENYYKAKVADNIKTRNNGNMPDLPEGEEGCIVRLSPREQEVLQLLSVGYFYKEIADKLCISTGTVRQHIHHIYTKLHVQNRTEALNKWNRKG